MQPTRAPRSLTGRSCLHSVEQTTGFSHTRVGELEPLKVPVQEFMQILSGRGYTGLEMETRTIAGERHAGNKPEAFNRGLRFIFQGK